MGLQMRVLSSGPACSGANTLVGTFCAVRDIVLVPIDAGDFEALADLRVEAMRENLERIGRFDPVRARERLHKGFAAEFTRHIVVGGERVGFVVLKPGETAWRLDHLYLKASAQRRGTGAAVLALVFAEVDAVAAPLRVGTLRVSAANRFYVRHGFRLVESGEFDNHYERDAIARRKASA